MPAPVLLVTMPWDNPSKPSIQLGILKPVLERAGIEARVRHLHLDFLRLLAEDGAFGTPQSALDAYKNVGRRNVDGEWIFAVPPFRKPTPAGDAAFAHSLPGSGKGRALFERMRRMRALVPAFLDACVASIAQDAPGLVGFSSTFSQHVPSLVLAQKLKKRLPTLKIVFGGSNCEGPMGEAVLRAFPFVDAVVRGEGELVLPRLAEDLLSGAEIRSQPGLCHRAGRRLVINDEPPHPVPMAEVPMPDYDAYFEALKGHPCEAAIRPRIDLPIESTRGCWWGVRSHCTFCGLNGATMAYRGKPADQVLEHLMALSRRHRRLKFHFTDNILSLEYLKTLLPRLKEARLDLEFFLETKSSLGKEDLRLLKAVGVRNLQPGIESLSAPILEIMGKGVSPIQNLRFLKWCAQFGIRPHWGILYGFPGEPREEYARMAALIPSLIHLPPPKRLGRIRIDRFSPYHQDPGKHGLRLTGPGARYLQIYPARLHRALEGLAYFFEHEHLDGRNPEDYAQDLRMAMAHWILPSPRPRSLDYRLGQGFLSLRDRRDPDRIVEHLLDELDAGIYLACDAGATPEAIHKRLGAAMPVPEIRRRLEDWTDARLLFREGDRFLSLALPQNPDADGTDLPKADG